MIQITVDYDKCCGSGNCVRSAPGVFDQDDDGIVVLLRQDDLTGQLAIDAQTAAGLCPTWAITTAVSDAETPARA